MGAVITLLQNGVSQREISRKTGVDRKTIRKVAQTLAADSLTDPPKSPTPATGSTSGPAQNPPPRPPGVEPGKGYTPTPSACEPHRTWIEEQVRLGRNATAIYQELVDTYGFAHGYNSVKRFCRQLRSSEPKQFDRLEFLPGE
jgi:transposase